jgi:predicted acylesterase/phospholipase RssA
LIVVRAAPGSRDNIKTAITLTVFSFDDYDFMHRKKINLALQGGGAYGAFTWGVLDHLLEDRRLEIEGITGASSGAINAVMLADGLARGGPQEARKRLADFWRAASFNGNLPEGQRRALDRLFESCQSGIRQAASGSMPRLSVFRLAILIRSISIHLRI